MLCKWNIGACGATRGCCGPHSGLAACCGRALAIQAARLPSDPHVWKHTIIVSADWQSDNIASFLWDETWTQLFLWAGQRRLDTCTLQGFPTGSHDPADAFSVPKRQSNSFSVILVRWQIFRQMQFSYRGSPWSPGALKLILQKQRMLEIHSRTLLQNVYQMCWWILIQSSGQRKHGWMARLWKVPAVTHPQGNRRERERESTVCNVMREGEWREKIF